MRAVVTALPVAASPSAVRAIGASACEERSIATTMNSVARFMGLLVNRRLSGASALALILIAASSCSDNSITGPDGLSTDDLSADDNRVIATVQVTLGSSTLEVGQTTQAKIVFLDKYGRVLRRTVVWSSSDPAIASVDTLGLVTALSPGAVSIIGSHNLKSGSAQLTVVASGGTSVPPGTGATNEPAGMTVISSRGFNALNDSPLWTDENPAKIALDASAPRSPSQVWRAVYPTGFAGGSAPANSWLEFSPHPRIAYVRWYFKYSSNWYGNGTGINKMFYVWTNANAPSVVIIAKGAKTGALALRIAGQDILKGGAGYGDAQNPDWDPNLAPSATISRGQWHMGEVILVGNTSGAANGSIDGWIDGVHVTSYSGIQFRSANAVWGDVNVDPVWGGIGGSVPATQTFDIDHFYMSGKN